MRNGASITDLSRKQDGFPYVRPWARLALRQVLLSVHIQWPIPFFPRKTARGFVDLCDPFADGSFVPVEERAGDFKGATKRLREKYQIMTPVFPTNLAQGFQAAGQLERKAPWKHAILYSSSTHQPAYTLAISRQHTSSRAQSVGITHSTHALSAGVTHHVHADPSGITHQIIGMSNPRGHIRRMCNQQASHLKFMRNQRAPHIICMRDQHHTHHHRLRTFPLRARACLLLSVACGQFGCSGGGLCLGS
eukprot:1161247-Pelagomonas_calceolata.AAC.8